MGRIQVMGRHQNRFPHITGIVGWTWTHLCTIQRCNLA
jgi:hypothetical protein